MALTQIDVQAFNNTVNAHEEVQSYIKTQQDKLAQEVEVAKGANSGEMISRLVDVHENWHSHMNDIGNQLGHMIHALKETGKGLQTQDASNTV